MYKTKGNIPCTKNRLKPNRAYFQLHIISSSLRVTETLGYSDICKQSILDD